MRPSDNLDIITPRRLRGYCVQKKNSTILFCRLGILDEKKKSLLAVRGSFNDLLTCNRPTVTHISHFDEPPGA